MQSVTTRALACLMALCFVANALASKATILAEAKNLKPLVTSVIAHQFLDATADLPAIKARRFYYAGHWLSANEDIYYGTRHGTPLAYIRPIEIMGQAGLGDLSGKRIFDFGYGNIGQLRLLASLGADVVGVDVDPFLAALYSDPADTGSIQRAMVAGLGTKGRLVIHSGQFPADLHLRDAVGVGYDVIVSKNVLKRGYIHPEQEVDPSMLVHIDVSDEEFVQIIYDALNKDGFFMMYNLSPAPNRSGQPYIPWADARCPFDRELLGGIGFRVLEYDRDDHENAHDMARALGWNEEMDLEEDLFSHYTLVVKV